MNTIRKRAIGDEKGKVLILVLVLLVVGGLVLTPLLGLASTGLTAGQVYERKTAQLYAADAGVEDALWKLLYELEPPGPCDAQGWKYPNAGDPPFEFELNGQNVKVIIEYVEHGGEGAFKITSTATGDDSSSTTIVSYVQGTYVEGGYTEGEIPNIGGDDVIYAAGNLTVTGNIEGNATVYVGGDLTVGNNIEGSPEGSPEVYVAGDLILSEGFANIEDDVIICVVGDVRMEGSKAEILDNIALYVEGDLNCSSILDGAEVCVEGSVTVGKIEGEAVICAGNSLTVTGESPRGAGIEGGYLYVGLTGSYTVLEGDDDPNVSDIFANCPLCSPDCPDCRICCECPLEWPTPEPGYWSGLDIANYNISP